MISNELLSKLYMMSGVTNPSHVTEAACTHYAHLINAVNTDTDDQIIEKSKAALVSALHDLSIHKTNSNALFLSTYMLGKSYVETLIEHNIVSRKLCVFETKVYNDPNDKTISFVVEIAED